MSTEKYIGSIVLVFGLVVIIACILSWTFKLTSSSVSLMKVVTTNDCVYIVASYRGAIAVTPDIKQPSTCVKEK